MRGELIRLPSTVAVKIGSDALLVPHDEFLAISEKALSRFEAIDRVEHSMWVRKNMVFSRGPAAVKAVHAAVLSEILKRHDEKKVTFCYAFRDAEAQRFLPDFLLAYHTSRKCISYAVEACDDTPDSMVSIEMREKQTLLGRLTRRLGEETGRLLFRMSSVRKLYGCSIDFYLTVDGVPYVYHFSHQGVGACDESELKVMNETYEKAAQPGATDNPGDAQ